MKWASSSRHSRSRRSSKRWGCRLITPMTLAIVLCLSEARSQQEPARYVVSTEQTQYKPTTGEQKGAENASNAWNLSDKFAVLWSPEAAGWAQAIGTILAILGAAWIAGRQAQLAEIDERGRLSAISRCRSTCLDPADRRAHCDDAMARPASRQGHARPTSICTVRPTRGISF